MMGLSDGERTSTIRSAVLIQITRVTDGRTDGIGVAYTRYSIYAVARNNQQKWLTIALISWRSMATNHDLDGHNHDLDGHKP